MSLKVLLKRVGVAGRGMPDSFGCEVKKMMALPSSFAEEIEEKSKNDSKSERTRRNFRHF